MLDRRGNSASVPLDLFWQSGLGQRAGLRIGGYGDSTSFSGFFRPMSLNVLFHQRQSGHSGFFADFAGELPPIAFSHHQCSGQYIPLNRFCKHHLHRAQVLQSLCFRTAAFP